MAVDRGALFNVIFQKQGEIDGEPAAAVAHRLRVSVSDGARSEQGARTARRTDACRPHAGVEGDGTMQLAAQRIALNLARGGVQCADGHAGTQHADLVLRKLPIAGGDPAAALEIVLRSTRD